MSYTNYQLPPNYGGYAQQQQQQYQHQPQYQQQPPAYPMQTSYPQQRPAPAPVSAPAFAYAPSSPAAPSMYSASTMSSYTAATTPSAASSSSNDLIPMYGSSQSVPPRPVSVSPPTTDSKPKGHRRGASHNDGGFSAIIASQERAMVEAKTGGQRARSLSPMMKRKDFQVPKNSTTKRPLTDGIHPEKYDMQKSRKQRTVAGATSGAVIGGLLAGPAFPVGIAIGGAIGGYSSNKMHKFNERRRQRRHEQRNFQKAAKQTVVAKSDNIVLV